MPLPEGPKRYGNNEGAGEEAPSVALLPVAVPTLLLLCSEGADLDNVCSHVLSSGIRPVHVPKIELAPPTESAPRHCFIELGLPGASAYLRAIAQSTERLYPVALLSSPDEAVEAYRLGAIATLTRPLIPEQVVAMLEGQRERLLLQQHSEVVVEHDRRLSTTNAFEGLLRALGQDVRNPLATALANVEFLNEVRDSRASPFTEEEYKAVVQDTLDSLQVIRQIIENVSGFMPKEPPVLNRLHLWSVAQRVIDEQSTDSKRVTLLGDPEVRGWGDETTLFDVTTTLVRRALDRRSSSDTMKVSIHVYAHDTEARLTVHDYSPPSSDPPAGDPFHPGLTLGRPGQSGLLLAAARHAIVRMGGALSYVPRTKAGCAFRVRLRLAQPTET
jgi:K+-sensing histidine kinase KdpD